MRLRLVLSLLVFSIFLQMLAGGLRADIVLKSIQATHVALHLEGQAHHHHDDGSIVQDGSEESVQHVALDGRLNCAAVLGLFPIISLPLEEGARLAATDELPRPWPDLAGLKRPPKLTA